jgi:hypothetical protein
MGHAAIALDDAGDRIEIVSFTLGLAARTEQQGVAGRSIETSVECRDPGRQQLDLGVGNRPVLVREVAHHLAWQVLVGHQIEEAARFFGHQASSPS